MGQEEAMPRQGKCVSTQQYCGGGVYTSGNCVCNTGYMTAGQSGEICIPQCSGSTSTCTAAGGNCTAVNFCSCGQGLTFSSSGQCLSTTDACGG